MENEFIPNQEALELRKLGFDEDGFGWWFRKDMHKQGEEELFIQQIKKFELPEYYILAPLYQQAFKFFREKCNLLGNIYSNASGYCWEIHDSIGGTHRFDSGESGDCEESGMFTTYEKAELECLKKLIEIVKK